MSMFPDLRGNVLRYMHSFFLARRIKLLINLMELAQTSRAQSILDLGGGSPYVSG